MAFGQAQRQSTTLVVNGKSGQVPVVQTNGRTYVDLEALARLANGSLSFSGNRIALTIPSSSASDSAASQAPAATDDSSLSRGFMRAGIEEMALLREWGAAVGYAVQNGYPIQPAWAANYQQKAAQGASLAEVATTTSGDKNALQLLTNEYHGVRDWSDRLVQASKNMNTAQLDVTGGAARRSAIPKTDQLLAISQFDVEQRQLPG
jgi:hypothetical protein